MIVFLHYFQILLKQSKTKKTFQKNFKRVTHCIGQRKGRKCDTVSSTPACLDREQPQCETGLTGCENNKNQPWEQGSRGLAPSDSYSPIL